MPAGIRNNSSKKKLREATFDCLREKALAEVTVKEVCERAGLNRVTFYRNYKTLNDIVSEVEQERLDQLRMLLASGEKQGEDLIREIVITLYEAKEIDVYEGVENLFKSFRAEIIKIAKFYALDTCIKLFPKVAPLDVELGLEIILTGVLQVIANRKNKYNCEEIIRMILAIRNDAIARYS